MEENGNVESFKQLQNSDSTSRPPLRKQFPQKKSHYHAHNRPMPWTVSPGFEDAQDGLRNLTVKNESCKPSKSGDFFDECGESVYGEIGKNSLLHTEPPNLYPNHNGNMVNSYAEDTPHSSCSIQESAKMGPNKVENYQLRPKRRRHVYHEIVLPCEKGTNDESNTSVPPKRAPPLPFKPHYLRSEFSGDAPPPLPPRVLNKAALIQRKQLTDEYFENIRKSVDVDLLNGFSDEECTSAQSSVELLRNDLSSRPSNINSNQETQYWTIDNNPCNSERRHSIPLLETQNNRLSPRILSSEESSEICIPKEKTFPSLHTGTRVQLIQSLKCLKQCGWYWGNMSWEDAETMLGYKHNVEGKL